MICYTKQSEVCQDEIGVHLVFYIILAYSNLRLFAKVLSRSS